MTRSTIRAFALFLLITPVAPLAAQQKTPVVSEKLEIVRAPSGYDAPR